MTQRRSLQQSLALSNHKHRNWKSRQKAFEIFSAIFQTFVATGISDEFSYQGVRAVFPHLQQPEVSKRLRNLELWGFISRTHDGDLSLFVLTSKGKNHEEVEEFFRSDTE